MVVGLGCSETVFSFFRITILAVCCVTHSKLDKFLQNTSVWCTEIVSEGKAMKKGCFEVFFPPIAMAFHQSSLMNLFLFFLVIFNCAIDDDGNLTQRATEHFEVISNLKKEIKVRFSALSALFTLYIFERSSPLGIRKIFTQSLRWHQTFTKTEVA